MEEQDSTRQENIGNDRTGQRYGTSRTERERLWKSRAGLKEHSLTGQDRAGQVRREQSRTREDDRTKEDGRGVEGRRALAQVGSHLLGYIHLLYQNNFANFHNVIASNIRQAKCIAFWIAFTLQIDDSSPSIEANDHAGNDCVV
jgi:hypothetical protein